MRGTPQRKCVGPPVLTGMDSIIMKCSLDDLDIIMSYDVWKLNINMPHDTMPLFILNATIHMMPNMAFLITISLITTSYYAKQKCYHHHRDRNEPPRILESKSVLQLVEKNSPMGW